MRIRSLDSFCVCARFLFRLLVSLLDSHAFVLALALALALSWLSHCFSRSHAHTHTQIRFLTHTVVQVSVVPITSCQLADHSKIWLQRPDHNASSAGASASSSRSATPSCMSHILSVKNQFHHAPLTLVGVEAVLQSVLETLAPIKGFYQDCDLVPCHHRACLLHYK